MIDTLRTRLNKEYMIRLRKPHKLNREKDQPVYTSIMLLKFSKRGFKKESIEKGETCCISAGENME